MSIPGVLLFAQYANPCLFDKLLESRICEDEFGHFKHQLDRGIEPEIGFLERCFPTATAALEKLARETNRETWDFETVSDYWRHFHGHVGDCAVKIATVCSVGPNKVQVIYGSETFTAVNLYGLDLQIGESVYIHRRVAIEKIE